MAPLEVTLPESVSDFVQRRVAEGASASASEYVAEVLIAEQRRRAAAELDALLAEGLASPASELTAQDWDDIRREGIERLEARKRT